VGNASAISSVREKGIPRPRLHGTDEGLHLSVGFGRDPVDNLFGKVTWELLDCSTLAFSFGAFGAFGELDAVGDCSRLRVR